MMAMVDSLVNLFPQQATHYFGEKTNEVNHIDCVKIRGDVIIEFLEYMNLVTLSWYLYWQSR